MNILYEKIAKAIRMNTITLRDNTIAMDVKAVEKEGVVEALSNHFSQTDTLFNSNDFKRSCEEDK